jgi:hypothetical protein
MSMQSKMISPTAGADRDPAHDAGIRPLTGIERARAEAERLAAGDMTSEDWREEVAARVQNYRTRRRRYNPELSLPLDFEEQRRANRHLVSSALQEPVIEAVAIEEDVVRLAEEPPAPPVVAEAMAEAPPASVAPIRCVHPRKIIEFPRSQAPPRPLYYELAEPMLEDAAPRILEAPPEQFELLPAVPAITLDEDQQPVAPTEEEEQFARIETASIARRLCCAVIDAVVIGIALAAFGFAFWKITDSVPLLRSRAAAMAIAAAIGIFWMAYHYAFLVYGRATLGMRLARVETRSFAGEALDRRARRLRALAMLVSLIAAGLGFAWTLLDEQRLSWHDRISRSYLAAR